MKHDHETIDHHLALSIPCQSGPCCKQLQFVTSEVTETRENSPVQVSRFRATSALWCSEPTHSSSKLAAIREHGVGMLISSRPGKH